MEEDIKCPLCDPQGRGHDIRICKVHQIVLELWCPKGDIPAQDINPFLLSGEELKRTEEFRRAGRI